MVLQAWSHVDRDDTSILPEGGVGDAAPGSRVSSREPVRHTVERHGALRRLVRSGALRDSVALADLQPLIPDPDTTGPDEYQQHLATLEALGVQPLHPRISSVADEATPESENAESSPVPGTLDSLGAYLREIGRVPLLTGAQEVALAQRIEAGDPEARNEMVAANLRLVIRFARRYARVGRVPIMDLIQEGNLGLIHAAKKFDWRRGYKFSTYASWWIWQAIVRALAEQGRTIRLPVCATERLDRIRKTYARLEQALGRAPNDEEVASELGLKAETVSELLTMVMEPVSLYAPVGAGDGHNDLLVADTQDEPDALPTDTAAVTNVAGGHAALAERLASILDAVLPARERTVLIKRFGLFGSRAYSLDELADETGIPRARLSALEAHALKQLCAPTVWAQLAAHMSLAGMGPAEHLKLILKTSLPARERVVLIKRRGLFKSRVHTLEELAEELDTDPDEIGVLEARALRRLRAPGVWARIWSVFAGPDPAHEDAVDRRLVYMSALEQ